MVRVRLVGSIEEAFAKWLGEGRPAYVPREKLSPAEAVALVQAAGGVAVVAHPGLLAQPAAAVRALATVGVDGVEVWHPKNKPDLREELLALVKELDIIATGGSDFHGENKPGVHLGMEHVDLAVLEALKLRRARGAARRGA